MRKFLSVVMAAAVALSSAAVYSETENGIVFAAESELQVGDTFLEGDLQYKVLENGNLSVDGCSCSTQHYICSHTKFDVPQIVKGRTVTEIDNWALSSCYNLESVTLPDTIEVIGFAAFKGCIRLSNINMPKNLKIIEGQAFGMCSSLGEIELPSNLKEIKGIAFDGCAITTITIPNSVEQIGSNPFLNCPNLRQIHVSQNNANYCDENGVLFNKEKTELIGFPAAYNAKYYDISDSVTAIGDFAFCGASVIESVTIPASVNEIMHYGNTDDNEAFGECSNLKAINVDSDNSQYCSENGVLFTKDMTKLIQYPIGRENETYSIPRGVERFNERSFADCQNLRVIVFPNGVEYIDGMLLAYCGNLTSIVIPQTVKVIGTFSDGYKLGNVLDIYYTGTSEEWNKIGIGANERLETANIIYNYDLAANGVPAPRDLLQPGEAFLQGNYKCKVLDDGTLEIAYSDRNAELATTADIPSVIKNTKVTALGERAFESARLLSSVTIPNGIKSIGKRAFNCCTNLTSVTMHSGIKRISSEAFYGCKNLTSIIIPDGVESIGDGAFDGSNLSEISIPDSVIRIGNIAFRNTPFLKNQTGIQYAGKVAVDSQKIYVEEPLLESTLGIADDAFSGKKFIQPVVLPDSLLCIGDRAFSHAIGFDSIKIPESVTYIGDYAFASCRDLKTIIIPKSVTYLGYGALGDGFEKNDTLTDIYYAGTEEEWSELYHFDGTATIHYNSSGPKGVDVNVDIEAPKEVDVSDQQVMVSGISEPITIKDGKLDISSLASGKYTFMFSAKNCAPRLYDVEVSGGVVSGLDDGVKLKLYGDIDGNGKINSSDILKAKLQAKGSQKLSDYDFTVADVTKDGKVNSTDILKLKLHAKGSTKLR